MKPSFSYVILEYLNSLDGFVMDTATKNPIERVGREVDSGSISWEEGVRKVKSSARLYRLSNSQFRELEGLLRKKYS